MTGESPRRAFRCVHGDRAGHPDIPDRSALPYVRAEYSPNPGRYHPFPAIRATRRVGSGCVIGALCQ